MKWFPSSPDAECVMVNAVGQSYESFPCLYPTIGKTYFKFEKNFNPFPYFDFMVAHPMIPVVAVGLYLTLIFGGQRYFRDRAPLNLRGPMAAWNLGLSLFSAMGVLRVAPQIVHLARHYTVAETLCMDPAQSFGSDGGAGLWMLLFCVSKIAELFDTFFIVVHKKPLIFLHWYHHLSVLLMCWHGYVSKAPAGILFGCVNYAVHSVMYFYYFLMAVHCKPKSFKAVYITMAQISQMVVGLGVTAVGFSLLYRGVSDNSGEACHLRAEQSLAVVVMYGSYLFLFLQFFFKRYSSSAKRSSKKTAAAVTVVPKDLMEREKNKNNSSSSDEGTSVESVSSDGGSNADGEPSNLDHAATAKLKAL